MNPIKLETGLRPNSAGIPYTLLLRVEAIGFHTFGLLPYLVRVSLGSVTEQVPRPHGIVGRALDCRCRLTKSMLNTPDTAMYWKQSSQNAGVHNCGKSNLLNRYKGTALPNKPEPENISRYRHWWAVTYILHSAQVHNGGLGILGWGLGRTLNPDTRQTLHPKLAPKPLNS